MFSKVDFNLEVLKGRNLIGQFEELRVFLEKKYKIEFITTFVKYTDKYEKLEGYSTIGLEFINSLELDSPQIRVAKEGLQDSKERGIKTRFIIPLKINEKSFMVVIEDSSYIKINGKEKEIYKDILKFKSMIDSDYTSN